MIDSMNFKISPWRSINTRLTLLSLLIFWAGIWSLTIYAEHTLRQDMQRISGEQQFSTVSLVAAQVNQDMSERMNALQEIAAGISPVILDNAKNLQLLLEQRQLLQHLFNGGVVVCDADGTVIADVPLKVGRIGTNYLDVDSVFNAIKHGKASIGRPIIGKKLQAPVFGMTVPIRDGKGKVIGSLSGVTNLGKPNFLDNITQNHYGNTGGYLLTIPSERLIVTATDKSRIMQELPAAGIHPMLDRFNQGYEGSAVFHNLLGVEVLCSARRIPVSGWMIGLTLPTAEAFAPIQHLQRRILLAAVFLTLLIGVMAWWVLRLQLAPLRIAAAALSKISKDESPLLSLPVSRPDEIGLLINAFNQLLTTLQQREIALQQSEHFVKLIAFNIPGMVGYWNRDLRCTFACDEYRIWFGRTIEQMQGIAMQDLLGEELFRKNKPYIEAVLRGENVQFERMLTRPDGTSGYTWGHYIAHQVDGVVQGFFVLESDITAQKKTQTALRQSEARYRRLAEDMPLSVATFLSDGTLTYANNVLATSVSIARRDLVGTNFFNYLPAGDRALIREKLAGLTPEAPIESHEQRYALPGGREVYYRWTNRAFFDAAGALVSVQAVGEDISARKRLEQEREQYFSFFQSSGDLLCIADPCGYIKRISPSFTRLTGFEESELVAKPLMDFVQLEDRQCTADEMTLQIQSGPTRHFENHYVCKDGSIVLLSWSAYFDQLSGLTYASARDITKSRQTEDALRESQTHNQALVSAIPDIIFTNARDGEFLSVHASDPTMLFFPPEHFLHKKIEQVLPHSIANPMMRAIIDAIDTGIVQQIQYQLPGDFDRERIFDARVIASADDTAITIVRDITELERERMRHEIQLYRRLQTSEQGLALASDAAKLGTCLHDLVLDVIWASDHWRSLYGFTAGESLTMAVLLDRVHQFDRQAVRQAFSDKSRGADKCEIEFRIELPDGGIRWITSVARIECDPDGRAILYRGVSLDITGRKQTELELQQKRTEVVHLSRMAMLGELSGALAHELNQPLTAILSNAQAAQRFLAQDTVDLDELRDILCDIVDEDKRAGEVIRGLRQMFDNGDIVHQSVDMNELVMEVSHILRGDMINHGVKMQMELGAENPVVNADRVQLQQVLINLLMNACDAMESADAAQRLLIVRTRIAEANVDISVIDHGHGILPSALDLVFDSFYTTKERGMGLGLSICRNIVNASGGELWCENNAGRGASFHFSMPLQVRVNA